MKGSQGFLFNPEIQDEKTPKSFSKKLGRRYIVHQRKKCGTEAFKTKKTNDIAQINNDTGSLRTGKNISICRTAKLEIYYVSDCTSRFEKTLFEVCTILKTKQAI